MRFRTRPCSLPLLEQPPPAAAAQPPAAPAAAAAWDFQLRASSCSSSSREAVQQQPRHLPFAVLSGSRLFGVRQDASGIRSVLSTFREIDAGGKGHITEADLAAFAEGHSLPQSYVRPFLDAVLQHHHDQQQQQQQQAVVADDAQQQLLLDSQRSGSGSSSSSDGDAVTFGAFRAFVASRELGLRQAFQAFDLDRDGHISHRDLSASLARVAICCPTSGCVMRPRREVVAQLLQRLNAQGEDRQLSFAEFRSFFMLLPEQGQLVEYWLSGPAAVSCADMGGHFSVLETSQQRRGSPWGHLVAGAVAGAASRTATAPLETLRLMAMGGRLPPGTSLLAAGTSIVASKGVGALYQGNLVNVLRSAPARAIDFFSFHQLKAWLGAESYAHTLTAAGLAGTLSWILLYPLEVVRSRMTLNAGSYSGIRHCVTHMLATEGPRAFARGLGTSVAAIAPEAACTYGLHDLLKHRYRSMYHSEPGIGASLACGVIAAWTGQMIAFPLESVSRRMQLAGAAAAAAGPAAAAAVTTSAVGTTAAAGGLAAAAAGGGGAGAAAAAGGAGVLQVLHTIMREGGGPAGLYRGLGAATLRLVPSAIISFGAYELVQKLWISAELQQEEARAREHHARLSCALTTAQRCGERIQQQRQLAAAAQPGDGAAAEAGQLLVQPLLLDSCCCSGSGGASSTSSTTSSSSVGRGGEVAAGAARACVVQPPQQ